MLCRPAVLLIPLPDNSLLHSLALPCKRAKRISSLFKGLRALCKNRGSDVRGAMPIPKRRPAGVPQGSRGKMPAPPEGQSTVKDGAEVLEPSWSSRAVMARAMAKRLAAAGLDSPCAATGWPGSPAIRMGGSILVSTEHGDAVVCGGFCAFAVAEDVDGLVAVRAEEAAHVFYHAEDFYVDLAKHF